MERSPGLGTCQCQWCKNSQAPGRPREGTQSFRATLPAKHKEQAATVATACSGSQVGVAVTSFPVTDTGRRHVHGTLRGRFAPASSMLAPACSSPRRGFCLRGRTTDGCRASRRQGARARTPTTCTNRSARVKHRALRESKECVWSPALPAPRILTEPERPSCLKTGNCRTFRPCA